MGWSKHHKNGLIHHSPQDCCQGYTLVTTTRGNFANLIDIDGRDNRPRRLHGEVTGVLQVHRSYNGSTSGSYSVIIGVKKGYDDAD